MSHEDHYEILRIVGEREEQRARAEKAEAELAERTSAVIISDGGQALACSASVSAVYGTVRAERDAAQAIVAALSLSYNPDELLGDLRNRGNAILAERDALKERVQQLVDDAHKNFDVGVASGRAEGRAERDALKDCRLCRSYSLKGCTALVQCVEGSGFRQMPPVRLWNEKP